MWRYARRTNNAGMSSHASVNQPSWPVLVVAALFIGPGLMVGTIFAVNFFHSDNWRSVPDIKPITASPSVAPDGVIAYAEHTGPYGPDAELAARGCVFVVAADGTSQPQRLGCAGDGNVAPIIMGIEWTSRGDLKVYESPPRHPELVLQVNAGQRRPGSDRAHAYRQDETRVHLAEVTEDRAEIAITPPGRRQKTIVSFDGPSHYQFGEPQWSPDGKWILVADTLGRLLITDDAGHQVHELLPARPAREWIEHPFLTWHQGRTK